MGESRGLEVAPTGASEFPVWNMVGLQLFVSKLRVEAIRAETLCFKRDRWLKVL